MYLYPYAARCREFEFEIASTLSADDRDVLRSDVAGLGRTKWWGWLVNNRAQIAEFLRSSPSRRAKLKKWRDPELRRRLCLGAMQFAHHAFLLLTEIDQHDLYEGRSYRDMAASAALAHINVLFSEEVMIWPFGDPDPFKKG